MVRSCSVEVPRRVELLAKRMLMIRDVVLEIVRGEIEADAVIGNKPKVQLKRPALRVCKSCSKVPNKTGDEKEGR